MVKEMANDIDEAVRVDVTELAFVSEVRAGIIEVDIDELYAALATRGQDTGSGGRLKSAGAVNTTFVVDQEMYEDGRYD
ncbi:MAG: hypothetical protein R6V07_01700 [Armatimonadota bacterium]